MTNNDKIRCAIVIGIVVLVAVLIGVGLAHSSDGIDYDNIGAIQLEEAIRLEREEREQQRIDNVLSNRHKVIAHAVNG